MVVSVSPRILGQGVDAVGPLGIDRVHDGINLADRAVHLLGDDLVFVGDIERAGVLAMTQTPVGATDFGPPGG
jgi:hypothetical protein